MTPNCIHLSILVSRLSLAESTDDYESQCRALDAIKSFIAPLKRTATERACAAADLSIGRMTAAHVARTKERA